MEIEAQSPSSTSSTSKQNPLDDSSTPPVEETAPSFTSSSAQLVVADKDITIRILKMHGSTLLFIGRSGAEGFDELGVAMPMSKHGNDKSSVLATTIMGPQVISDSQHLAEKLSKRFQRQFFVSLNVNLDRGTQQLLEERLIAYIRSNEEKFA